VDLDHTPFSVDLLDTTGRAIGIGLCRSLFLFPCILALIESPFSFTEQFQIVVVCHHALQTGCQREINGSNPDLIIMLPG
jgi:hypothetical protein